MEKKWYKGATHPTRDRYSIFYVSGTVPGTLYKLSFNPYSNPMRMRWHYPYFIKKLAEV